MLGFNRKRATLSCLVVVAVCSLNAAVQGATINIILSNLDVSYNGGVSGGVLFDSMGGTPGGSMNPLLADAISTAVFEVDGSTVGTLPIGTEDLYGDLSVVGMGASIAKGVLHPSLGTNGGGFGFDFFTSSGFQVNLGLTDVSLLVTNNVFFFTGTAALLPGQNLPFGLKFDETQPLVFSYTATLPAVQAGTSTTFVMSSGALTISGIAIPEPAALATLCVGLLALPFGLFRRPNRG